MNQLNLFQLVKQVQFNQLQHLEERYLPIAVITKNHKFKSLVRIENQNKTTHLIDLIIRVLNRNIILTKNRRLIKNN